MFFRPGAQLIPSVARHVVCSCVQCVSSLAAPPPPARGRLSTTYYHHILRTHSPTSHQSTCIEYNCTEYSTYNTIIYKTYSTIIPQLYFFYHDSVAFWHDTRKKWILQHAVCTQILMKLYTVNAYWTLQKMRDNCIPFIYLLSDPSNLWNWTQSWRAVTVQYRKLHKPNYIVYCMHILKCIWLLNTYVGHMKCVRDFVWCKTQIICVSHLCTPVPPPLTRIHRTIPSKRRSIMRGKRKIFSVYDY